MNKTQLLKKMKSQCRWGFIPNSTQCKLTTCKYECLKGTEFEGERFK